MEEGLNGFFIQLCKDAMKDLKKHKTSYVFSKEHVDYIKNQKGFENITYTETDGIFSLVLA